VQSGARSQTQKGDFKNAWTFRDLRSHAMKLTDEQDFKNAWTLRAPYQPNNDSGASFLNAN